MTYPALYRRRLIPDECILLKDDIVLEWNEDRIVTSWKALHPKKDLHHGSYCYFLKEGFKVSEFLAEDGSLLYWYCDIVSYDFDKTQNTMIVTDLLADVIIYPDAFRVSRERDLHSRAVTSSSRSTTLTKPSG